MRRIENLFKNGNYPSKKKKIAKLGVIPLVKAMSLSKMLEFDPSENLPANFTQLFYRVCKTVHLFKTVRPQLYLHHKFSYYMRRK